MNAVKLNIKKGLTIDNQNSKHGLFNKMEKALISIKGTSLEFKEKSKEDTLLDSGLSSKISLPYGCKSGACGSCATKLLAGSIKTKAGDIVTNNNTILLCQSYSISNKIIL